LCTSSDFLIIRKGFPRAGSHFAKGFSNKIQYGLSFPAPRFLPAGAFQLPKDESPRRAAKGMSPNHLPLVPETKNRVPLLAEISHGHPVLSLSDFGNPAIPLLAGPVAFRPSITRSLALSVYNDMIYFNYISTP